MCVVAIDKYLDGFSQIFDAGEAPVIQGVALRLTCPSLDHIKPGRPGEREMQFDARMLLH